VGLEYSKQESGSVLCSVWHTKKSKGDVGHGGACL
jgi:hypothetical protein